MYTVYGVALAVLTSRAGPSSDVATVSLRVDDVHNGILVSSSTTVLSSA